MMTNKGLQQPSLKFPSDSRKVPRNHLRKIPFPRPEEVDRIMVKWRLSPERNNFHKKKFIWAHSIWKSWLCWLANCFGTCKKIHHSDNVWKRNILTSRGSGGKNREGRKDRDSPNLLQGHTHSEGVLIPSKLHLFKCLHLPKGLKLRIKSSMHQPLGTFENQTVTCSCLHFVCFRPCLSYFRFSVQH